jgi:hypothetical protein
VNIAYGNLKSENSQHYAQKPQRKVYVHEFGIGHKENEKIRKLLTESANEPGKGKPSELVSLQLCNYLISTQVRL